MLKIKNGILVLVFIVISSPAITNNIFIDALLEYSRCPSNIVDWLADPKTTAHDVVGLLKRFHELFDYTHKSVMNGLLDENIPDADLSLDKTIQILSLNKSQTAQQVLNVIVLNNLADYLTLYHNDACKVHDRLIDGLKAGLLKSYKSSKNMPWKDYFELYKDKPSRVNKKRKLHCSQSENARRLRVLHQLDAFFNKINAIPEHIPCWQKESNWYSAQDPIQRSANDITQTNPIP